MHPHDTPVGRLILAASDTGITVCSFADIDTVRERHPEADAGTAASDEIVASARRELDAYFAGELREFTVPVDLRYSNAFDRLILSGLSTVTYGATTTYGALAQTSHLPTTAVRGVGGALAGNPVLVIVPCHRVVGADGSLVGYAGGLAAKRGLLDLETADRLPRLDLVF